jgi:hypothetical protein
LSLAISKSSPAPFHPSRKTLFVAATLVGLRTTQLSPTRLSKRTGSSREIVIAA